MAWVQNGWQECGRKNLSESFVRKVESLAKLSDRDVASERSSLFGRTG